VGSAVAVTRSSRWASDSPADCKRRGGQVPARGPAGGARVPVQHQRFAGQMHAFFTLVNVLPGAADGLDYVAVALDRHLAAT
jgi:acetyl esterase